MKIVILSGAGLSAESGIETFRDSNGLWNNYSIEEVATIEGFTANPEVVHKFYNQRRNQIINAAPNPAHYALAKLELEPEVELIHITQNIDDLCERAGGKNIIHMHGEIMKCRCLLCGKVSNCTQQTSIAMKCPACSFGSEWGGIRPHIVWFNETPLFLKEIENAVVNCNLFAAIGTSGKIHPAASLVKEAHENGAATILLNKEPAENSKMFDKVIYGNASEIVPQWVKSIIAK